MPKSNKVVVEMQKVNYKAKEASSSGSDNKMDIRKRIKNDSSGSGNERPRKKTIVCGPKIKLDRNEEKDLSASDSNDITLQTSKADRQRHSEAENVSCSDDSGDNVMKSNKCNKNNTGSEGDLKDDIGMKQKANSRTNLKKNVNSGALDLDDESENGEEQSKKKPSTLDKFKDSVSTKKSRHISDSEEDNPFKKVKASVTSIDSEEEKPSTFDSLKSSDKSPKSKTLQKHVNKKAETSDSFHSSKSSDKNPKLQSVQKHVNKKTETSDNDSEEEKPLSSKSSDRSPKLKTVQKRINKDAETSDSDFEEEKPLKSRNVQKRVNKKTETRDSDSEEDKPLNSRGVQKRVTKKAETSDSDSEEEKPLKSSKLNNKSPKSKPVQKHVNKKAETSDSDLEVEKPLKSSKSSGKSPKSKPIQKLINKKTETSDSDSEEEKPLKSSKSSGKSPKSKTIQKPVNEDDTASDSDEDKSLRSVKNDTVSNSDNDNPLKHKLPGVKNGAKNNFDIGNKITVDTSKPPKSSKIFKKKSHSGSDEVVSPEGSDSEEDMKAKQKIKVKFSYGDFKSVKMAKMNTAKTKKSGSAGKEDHTVSNSDSGAEVNVTNTVKKKSEVESETKTKKEISSSGSKDKEHSMSESDSDAKSKSKNIKLLKNKIGNKKTSNDSVSESEANVDHTMSDSDSGSKRKLKKNHSKMKSGSKKKRKGSSDDSTEHKPDTKKKKSNTEPPEKNKRIINLKRYIHAAGVRVKSYAILWKNCRSNKQRADKLKDLLENHGLKGNPTMEKCRKLRKKLETKREVEELDLGNIIDESGPRGRSSRRKSQLMEFDTDQQSPQARRRLPTHQSFL